MTVQMKETYNQFYYCSNDTIGEMAAEAFLEIAEQKGISTDSGVLGMNTNVENEALNHRVDSFRTYMEKNAPGLELTIHIIMETLWKRHSPMPKILFLHMAIS